MQARAKSLQNIRHQGGCHVGNEQVNISLPVYSRLTTSGITCRDGAQGVSGTGPLAAMSRP